MDKKCKKIQNFITTYVIMKYCVILCAIFLEKPGLCQIIHDK